ncbi:MAG: CHASE2 domain-containing protein [Cyanobacteria bacterium P01_A01_bin.84]
MSATIILSLGQGDLYTGFPTVTVHLGTSDNFYKMKLIGSLPPALELAQIYQSWRSLYDAFYQRTRLSSRQILIDDDLEIEEAGITNFSEADFANLSSHVSSLINVWMSSVEFRNIEKQLRTQLEPDTEIRFILETNDITMRRLPWHLWSFFNDYTLAEVALSTQEYQKSNQFKVDKRTDKVKILAIFGESTGIDINRDRSFLEKLSHKAEIEFVVEPALTDLNEQLWKQGWDILFFAGHTSGADNGLVYINKTDTIALPQIKYALRQAISRGLKLAIFNSCDSLALAGQLQDLQIPQVIVMREPVPDLVAQDFLKYFLAEFSQGKSLYRSVRFARERLQVLEVNYPCATWLPVICQNPAEAAIVWTDRGLITEDINNQSAKTSYRNNLVSISTVESIETKPNRDLLLVNDDSAIIKQKKSPVRIFNFFNWNKHSLQRLILASLLVTFSVVGVRYLGMLQTWELKAYDDLMQLRPAIERQDSRLLIVSIDEADIRYQNKKKMNRRSSLADEALNQLLQKLDKYEPQAIGIDIYRDSSSDIKFPDLAKRLQTDNSIFGICKVAVREDGEDGIPASNETPPEQVGFSDFLSDFDEISRRQLLFLNPPPSSPCTSKYAFNYLLARKYLQGKGYQEPRFNQDKQLEINNVVFKQLKPHSSGYQREDMQGYQILLNYRSLNSARNIAPSIAMRKILEDEIEGAMIDSLKNRIILLGVTAPSSTDYWKTPYSETYPPNRKVIPGVYIQAQMLSNILSAVEDKRALIWWFPGWIESIWIFLWAVIGGLLAVGVRKTIYLATAIAILFATIFIICFLVFTQAGWIPLIPSCLAVIICAITVKTLEFKHFGSSRKK